MIYLFLFRGILVNQINCLKCGKINEREEKFYDLMIQVKNFQSLEESLENFLTPQNLDGSNQYFCDKCNEKVSLISIFLLFYYIL